MSYQLPAATFQRLESRFSSIASLRGKSASGTLSRLGIDPTHWLVGPTIVGSENVGGAETTHIHAGVNVVALLVGLNTILQNASSLGLPNAGGVPTSIPPSTRSKIAAEVQNPSLDVWIGTDDKTARRLAVDMTLAVSGQISAVLGGLRSAGIDITLQYVSLNQPQNITAPTSVRPYREFTAKIKPILQALPGTLAGGLIQGAATGSSRSSSSRSAATVQSYGQCIQTAHNDVAKVQKCALLLNGH